MTIEEKLIELVQEQTIIYDMTNRDYNNLALKAKIWTDIAHECRLKSGEDARKMWTKLRDAFRSSLKRLESNRGSDPGVSVKMWRYHEQMYFLKPYMKDRKRHFNETFQGYEADERGTDETFEESIDSADIFESKKPKLVEEKYSIFPFVRDETQIREDKHTKDEYQRQLFKPPDEIKLFFDSMYECTKKLKPSLQRVVKRKLFEAVQEAEDMMELNNTQSLSSTSVEKIIVTPSIPCVKYETN